MLRYLQKDIWVFQKTYSVYLCDETKRLIKSGVDHLGFWEARISSKSSKTANKYVWKSRDNTKSRQTPLPEWSSDRILSSETHNRREVQRSFKVVVVLSCLENRCTHAEDGNLETSRAERSNFTFPATRARSLSSRLVRLFVPARCLAIRSNRERTKARVRVHRRRMQSHVASDRGYL